MPNVALEESADSAAGITRPAMLTEEMEQDIMEDIAKAKTLRSISEKPGMPALGTMRRWIRENVHFRHLYARAKEDAAEYMAEDILSIADDGTNDTFTDTDGNVHVDNDVIQRSKLRVDARKWLAAKLMPRKYGDVPAQTNVAIGVQVQVLPEDKRTELMERHRKALEAGGE